MSEMTSYAQGQFCWVDVMSGGIAEAKTFYGGLFGWTFFDEQTGGPPYVQFLKNGKKVAGLGELNEDMKSQGVPPMWNSYIAVTDVDATAKKIEELGGTITMPAMQVLDAGRMLGFRDPVGAHCFLWQAGAHFGAETVNEPSAFSWNELATREVDVAKKFYGDLFGWTFEEMDSHGGPRYVSFKNDGRESGGILEMDENWPPQMPSIWSVYFTVEDCDASVAKVKELGGTVFREPWEIPGVGRIAVVADPHGAAFEIIKMFGEPL